MQYSLYKVKESSAAYKAHLDTVSKPNPNSKSFNKII